MFINLINYCDQTNINVFNLVPFTIIINNTKDVDYCLEAISDIIKFVNKYKNINKNIITNKKYSELFWFDKNFESLKREYINIDKNFLSDKNVSKYRIHLKKLVKNAEICLRALKKNLYLKK